MSAQREYDLTVIGSASDQALELATKHLLTAINDDAFFDTEFERSEFGENSDGLKFGFTRKNSENEFVHKRKKVGQSAMPEAPSRQEIDAKLELLLARSDARARETELQAEARLSRFEERMDQSIGEMRRDRQDFKNDLNQFKVDVKADLADQQKIVKSENKATRWTIGFAALSTVVGIAAFNATVLGNMTASFESGKSTADAIAKASDQLRQSQELYAKTAEALKQASERAPAAPK